MGYYVKGAKHMKIAICDDDPQELLRITTLLGNYRSEWQERIY